jgi:hypothetical protein
VYTTLQTTLSLCTPPVIPFMGFYLTQVTYIDENDDTRDGMVNFNKMMMLGTIELLLPSGPPLVCLLSRCSLAHARPHTHARRAQAR